MQINTCDKASEGQPDLETATQKREGGSLWDKMHNFTTYNSFCYWDLLQLLLTRQMIPIFKGVLGPSSSVRVPEGTDFSCIQHLGVLRPVDVNCLSKM